MYFVFFGFFTYILNHIRFYSLNFGKCGIAYFKLVDGMHYMLDNIMTNKSKMKTLQIDLLTMLMVIVYIKLYMTAIKFTLERLVEVLKFNLINMFQK